MKRTMLSIMAASAAVAFAADVQVRTSIGTGTITEYRPGTTFIVKEASGPVTYRYSDRVTYVTRRGAVLTDDEVRTRLRIGVPVRVHYGLEGDARIISRVELDDVDIDDDDDDDDDDD